MACGRDVYAMVDFFDFVELFATAAFNPYNSNAIECFLKP
jgi:hypothetical protein